MSTRNARRLFWDAGWFCNCWGSILVVGAEVVQSVVCDRYVQRGLGINARRVFGVRIFREWAVTSAKCGGGDRFIVGVCACLSLVLRFARAETKALGATRI